MKANYNTCKSPQWTLLVHILALYFMYNNNQKKAYLWHWDKTRRKYNFLKFVNQLYLILYLKSHNHGESVLNELGTFRKTNLSYNAKTRKNKEGVKIYEVAHFRFLKLHTVTPKKSSVNIFCNCHKFR